ncbi:ribosome biogenesis GTPase YqeH [Gemelliphila asaccharolytica]|uniref:Ribosome biogenesis GTPase YqeH n=1 Tax=Gemelliphila asaccharolytica TaxID=502393 RepID=A0ABR5TNJ9_9BACL|nr:ribosome biogenesis GTPase YqeH [Gemella asaccharolytica]
MKKIICVGCGIEIQTNDSNLEGYLPKEVIEKTASNRLICKRCFRLKNYNKISDVNIGAEDFSKIIKELSKKDALIVKVIDIFDLSGSFIDEILEIIGNKKDLILVANKMDLLPKSVKENKVKQWLYKEMKKKNIKFKDIILLSAIKGHNLEELIEKLEKYRKKRDIYILGATNVGKSTLINKLIENTSGEKNVITTSHFPGTTLDIIKIPLDSKSSIYDTPGIILDYNMAHYLDEKSLKIAIPKKEIKPKVYQLNSNQSLFLGGMCRMDFVKGERQSFTIYISNMVDIHRSKMKKADIIYKKHLGKLLNPPFEENLSIFKKNVATNFNISEQKKDIVISGLGWITINSPKGCEIKILAPKEIKVFERDSII